MDRYSQNDLIRRLAFLESRVDKLELDRGEIDEFNVAEMGDAVSSPGANVINIVPIFLPAKMRVRSISMSVSSALSADIHFVMALYRCRNTNDYDRAFTDAQFGRLANKPVFGLIDQAPMFSTGNSDPDPFRWLMESERLLDPRLGLFALAFATDSNDGEFAAPTAFTSQRPAFVGPTMSTFGVFPDEIQPFTQTYAITPAITLRSLKATRRNGF